MSENNRIELDMGLSEKDFDSVLPNAVKPYEVQITDTGYSLENDSGLKVIIDKTVMPPRVIASARLPRMMVVLTFDGHTEADVKEFMKRFNRYIHRGGG